MDAFLRPIGTDLLRQRDMLRRLRDKALALSASGPEPIKPESAEEREAISARFNAQLAAVQATNPPEANLGGGRTSHPPPFRPVTLKGEALWLARNMGRRANGLPELPKPPSFESYGESRTDAIVQLTSPISGVSCFPSCFKRDKQDKRDKLSPRDAGREGLQWVGGRQTSCFKRDGA